MIKVYYDLACRLVVRVVELREVSIGCVVVKKKKKKEGQIMKTKAPVAFDRTPPHPTPYSSLGSEKGKGDTHGCFKAPSTDIRWLGCIGWVGVEGGRVSKRKLQ
jgi:hypothetical protein